MTFYKNITMVVAVLVVLVSSTAVAIEYFPSEDGPVFNYPSGTVTIHPYASGFFTRQSSWANITYSSQGFLINPDGDVLLSSLAWGSSSAPDLTIHSFEPDLTYLDFPLEKSKMWTSTGIESDTWAGPIREVTLVGIVNGRETVTVEAGTFEVMSVTLYYYYDYVLDRTEVLWLHAQLGPVNELRSWSGIVPTQSTSWGSIKSLYR